MLLAEGYLEFGVKLWDAHYRVQHLQVFQVVVVGFLHASKDHFFYFGLHQERLDNFLLLLLNLAQSLL